MTTKTQFKTDIVERYKNGESSYQISKNENYSYNAVLRELKRRGINTGLRFWTKKEIKKLKGLYPITSKEELLKEFPNRKEKAIGAMARNLRLKKRECKKTCKGCGKEFTVKIRHNRELCLECLKKHWEHNNSENHRERQKQWIQRNPKYIKEYVKRPEARKRIRLYIGLYQKERRKEDPKFRLDQNMTTFIRLSLKGEKAGRKWEKLVGYTLKDLTKHLESLFDDKMNWENYGTYWHIDHIKPRSLFKYKLTEDPGFKECWSLKNLQPLEKSANFQKSNTFSS